MWKVLPTLKHTNKLVLQAMFSEKDNFADLGYLFNNSSKSYYVNDLDDLTSRFKNLPGKIRKQIRNKYEKLKKYNLPEQFINQEIDEFVDLLINSYSRKKEYYGLYDSRYMRHRIEDIIFNPEIRSVHYIFMDINGLKSVGEFGKGYFGIKDLIGEISAILSKGRTVTNLRDIGVFIESYQEGGDEFGILVYSNSASGESIVESVIHGLAKEISSIKAHKYIDFESSKILQYLGKRNCNAPNSQNFKFSVSFGCSSLTFPGVLNDEDRNVLAEYSVEDISSQLTRISQEKCTENKHAFKELLFNEGFLETYHLYSIRAIEGKMVKA